VMGSGCPVRVRRKLVEFGGSLVRIIWHAGLPSITCASRGSFQFAALYGAMPGIARKNTIARCQSAGGPSPWHRTAVGTSSASEETAYLRICLGTVQK
jgi:hypothetical protein